MGVADGRAYAGPNSAPHSCVCTVTRLDLCWTSVKHQFNKRPLSAVIFCVLLGSMLILYNEQLLLGGLIGDRDHTESVAIDSTIVQSRQKLTPPGSRVHTVFDSVTENVIRPDQENESARKINRLNSIKTDATTHESDSREKTYGVTSTNNEGSGERNIPSNAQPIATNHTSMGSKYGSTVILNRTQNTCPSTEEIYQRSREIAPSSNASGAGVNGEPLARLYVPGFRSQERQCDANYGANVTIVILVTTAPDHEHQRRAIRSTWGSLALRLDIVLRFFIGTTSADTQLAIDREQAQYGDIVQANFVDSYNNLTLKTVAMLEWMQTYCCRAKLLLKTDDDMFINTQNLMTFAQVHSNSRRTIYGRLAHKWKPIRSKQSKYYIDKSLFADTYLPDFVTGPAYVLTADILADLYRAAMQQTYLKLEDVYVTGKLAQLLHIERRNAKEFVNEAVENDTCTYKKYISFHMTGFNRQFDNWERVNNESTHCQQNYQPTI